MSVFSLMNKGDQSWVGVHWKDWCWRWNSNTLVTSWEELTHWKRPWCREGLGAGGEGDDRGWDGWMASLTRWTWVWVNSRSWWWTGRPGVLRFIGSQRVRHDWATELNLLMFQLLVLVAKNSHISWLLLYLFGAVPQRYLRVCLPDLSPQHVHRIKHGCAWFFSWHTTG